MTASWSGRPPRPPGVLAGLRREGVRLLESYGMSETCGGYAYDGTPIRDVDVRLRAGDDRITIAGPTLFSGYRLRPDLTAESLVDGRLVTQDVGRLVDGRLELLGRADDVIVTGGEKVAPASVVGALLGCAGVREVAVLGSPDAEWGQAVVAYVVPDDPSSPPDVDVLRAPGAGGPRPGRRTPPHPCPGPPAHAAVRQARPRRPGVPRRGREWRLMYLSQPRKVHEAPLGAPPPPRARVILRDVSRHAVRADASLKITRDGAAG